MVALLKEKAKVNIVHKPRKTYDVADCLKRKRESSFDKSKNQKPSEIKASPYQRKMEFRLIGIKIN